MHSSWKGPDGKGPLAAVMSLCRVTGASLGHGNVEAAGPNREAKGRGWVCKPRSTEEGAGLGSQPCLGP